MRTGFAALVVILVVLGLPLAGLAARSAGVEFQAGSTEFVLGVNGADEQFSVGMPLYRLTYVESLGPWTISGFYSDSRNAKATVDPASWEAPAHYDSQYGSYRAFGADLGYALSLGGFSLQPKVGYRDTTVLAHGKDDPDPDGYWNSDSEGLRTRGFRLGLEVGRAIGEKLRIKAETGLYPGLNGYEANWYSRHIDDGNSLEYYYWQPVGLTTSQSDLTLGVEYQFSEALVFNASYTHAAARLKYDSTLSWLTGTSGEGAKFTTSQFNAGVIYRF